MTPPAPCLPRAQAGKIFARAVFGAEAEAELNAAVGVSAAAAAAARPAGDGGGGAHGGGALARLLGLPDDGEAPPGERHGKPGAGAGAHSRPLLNGGSRAVPCMQPVRRGSRGAQAGRDGGAGES
eukprot:SAG22_NODE_2289_length_2753_cov_11.769028_4_plen_125_part_00